MIGHFKTSHRIDWSKYNIFCLSFNFFVSKLISASGLPGVLWVLPDSYLDVPNKDYGGDLFVGGQVIHRPQFNFSQRQQQNRNRPRPRYDRRRETMQVERCDQTTVNPQQISDQEQHWSSLNLCMYKVFV